MIRGTTSGGAALPVLAACQPTNATAVAVDLVVSLSGSNFLLGMQVTLERSDHATRAATALQITPSTMRSRLDFGGLATGARHVVIINPDGQWSALSKGFVITGALWADDREGDRTGWSSSALQGTPDRTKDTAQAKSPTHSFCASGVGAQMVAHLISPPILIPASARRNGHLHSGTGIKHSPTGMAWYSNSCSTGGRGST